jgi:hypothetical protein
VPVDVGFLDDVGVVEMVLAGVVAPPDLDEAVTRAGVLGAERLSNWYLIDARDITAGGSAFAVLALAEYLSSIPPGVIEREAVLLPCEAAAKGEMEFFETACRNRGLDVRVFGERDEALAWLTA